LKFDCVSGVDDIRSIERPKEIYEARFLISRFFLVL